MRAYSALTAHEIDPAVSSTIRGTRATSDVHTRADARAGRAASRRSSAAPAMSRSRANSRTVTRIAPSAIRRASSSVGIGGRAFDPDVAALEVFVLPDRRDLLDALDRIAARGERFGTVRRRGGDDDARLADLHPADAVMNRQRRSTAIARPPPRRFGANAFSASGSYALVLEPEHARPPLWSRTRPTNVVTAPQSADDTIAADGVARRADPQ